MADPKKTKFGLIGDGKIAKRHRTAIESLGGEIGAVFDPIYSNHPNLDTEFFDGLEYVAICSPTMRHCEHIQTALKHNVKVIVEKPMVLPWQPIIDNPDVFMVLQMRYCQLPRKAKKIKLVISRNSKYFESTKGHPRATGGMFYNVFIHYVDLAMRTGATIDAIVINDGHQEAWLDDIDLLSVDMDSAYRAMYSDIMLNAASPTAGEIARLYYHLARYTERFGAGKEILNKHIEINPTDLSWIRNFA